MVREKMSYNRPETLRVSTFEKIDCMDRGICCAKLCLRPDISTTAIGHQSEVY